MDEKALIYCTNLKQIHDAFRNNNGDHVERRLCAMCAICFTIPATADDRFLVEKSIFCLSHALRSMRQADPSITTEKDFDRKPVTVSLCCEKKVLIPHLFYLVRKKDGEEETAVHTAA